MIFRPMRKDEIDKVIKFLERNHDEVDGPQLSLKYDNWKEIIEWQKKDETPEIIGQYVRGNPKGEMFVLEDDNGKIKGTGAIQYSKSNNPPKLRYMATYPTGKGTGSELIKHLEEYAMSKKIPELRVDPNPVAEGFYTKMGYEIIDRYKYKTPTEHPVEITLTTARKIFKKTEKNSAEKVR